MTTTPVSSSIDEIITSIGLVLSNDYSKDKYFIVLEGIEDIHFFNRFFEINNLINTESGKDAVIKICKYFFEENRCFGIVDRDYVVCTYLNNKIFAYDFSCLEMMLLSNEEVRNSIKSELLFTDKSEFDEYLLMILKNLHFLSLLRRFNEENGRGINFEGLKFSNLITQTSKILDPYILVDELKKINQREILSNDETQKLILDSKKENDLHYYLAITRGHDFINLFRQFISIDKSISKKEEHYQTILRTSYRESDFTKTDLYDYLNAYFTINLNKSLKSEIQKHASR
ncbi:hypothetical protein MmiAt1_11140 [Methanimicrococcus sp. At1]|uniref:DUF4435 domain-containing protein n=1 Tax=Methanimicrococcus hacksteinii TaxID=3028293 RepID=A0ABU3VQ53_9EURY|nr:hypothetical protein [Methanimicrococcus sp. At1]MDV0445531.1 hypothetical protein [Methanimicrococcus sp. At1]